MSITATSVTDGIRVTLKGKKPHDPEYLVVCEVINEIAEAAYPGDDDAQADFATECLGLSDD